MFSTESNENTPLYCLMTLSHSTQSCVGSFIFMGSECDKSALCHNPLSIHRIDFSNKIPNGVLFFQNLLCSQAKQAQLFAPFINSYKSKLTLFCLETVRNPNKCQMILVRLSWKRKENTHSEMILKIFIKSEYQKRQKQGKQMGKNKNASKLRAYFFPLVL